MADFYSDWHSVPNGGAKYRIWVHVEEAGRNAETNQTTLAYELSIQKDRSYQGFYDYWADWGLDISGVQVAGEGNVQNPTAPWNGWASHILASGRTVVTHSPDGTKTNIPIVATWQRTGGGGPSGYAPGPMGINTTLSALTPIPRATQPTVTPSPATVGTSVTIKMPRAVNTFTHDVTWVSGNLGGTIATGAGETLTWTVPDVMDEFPGKKVAPITINVATRSGGNLIGAKQFTLLARDTPTIPSSAPVHPDKQFDIRARRVQYVGSEWVRTTVVPADTITLVDSASATATATLGMSRLNAVDFPDHSIVDIEVYDGDNWVFTDHRMVLLRVETDDVDPTQAVTYSGTEFIDYSLGRAYMQRDHYWDGATDHGSPTNPGRMLKHALQEAKARGWGPRIEWEFNENVTSLGDPWANTSINRNFSAGTPLSQILEGLVNDGYLEYRTEYRDNKAYLMLFNPGTGSDYASDGSSPIVNLALADLTRAPRRGSVESRLTRVTVQGDTVTNYGDKNTSADNTSTTTKVTRERTPFDANVFGHLEGWVQASGVATDAAASAIGDNALRDNEKAVSERTFEMETKNATPQFYPFSVFLTGDWVLIPDATGPLKDRISQITIDKQIDSRKMTVLTGDRILSGTASLAKRQAAQVGGSISGGNMTSPAPLDSRIPSAPVIDLVTSAGYWNSDGAGRSSVTISWAKVAEALNGSNIGIDLYEVWWRPLLSDVEWKYRTSTTALSATMTDFDPLDNLEFRVRAHSTGGVFGEFSENQEITTLEPATDLDGPDLADLYTDGVGNIYAVWGGTLDGAPAPSRVAYVVAEVSSDGGTVYTQMGTPIVAAGNIVINPNAYGTFEVRLRSFDRLGNPGDASDPQTITTSAPASAAQKPLAPTGLVAVPGAGYDAAGINPTAWFDLAWNAVIEDIDGNPVDIIGYDVWGKRTDEDDLRFLTSVSGNSARWVVDPSEEWSFQVAATSTTGGVSDLSDPSTATANATNPPPPIPAAPTLEQYAGILKVKWSGGGMQPYIKYVYATISSTLGGTYSRAGMTLNGAGEVVVTGLAPGNYYAKIVMVAEDGQTSTSAAAGPLTLLPITGVTIQTSPLANTGIKMTDAALTAYDAMGQPTFVLDATTGEVWIAPYDAVFEFGADGVTAETGVATTGLAISDEGVSFNTFFHAAGVQIRNDQTPLSWWEADASDAGNVNFVSPRANITQRLRVGDYEFLPEVKAGGGTRLVIRYKGD